MKQLSYIEVITLLPGLKSIRLRSNEIKIGTVIQLNGTYHIITDRFESYFTDKEYIYTVEYYNKIDAHQICEYRIVHPTTHRITGHRFEDE